MVKRSFKMKREGTEKTGTETGNFGQDMSISSELPSAISNKATEYCLIGALLILLSSAFCVMLKEIGVVVFCIFGIWLFYYGLALRIDYMKGKICRMPVKCLNVQMSRFGDRAAAAFETLSALEDRKYLQYRISGKKRSEELIPNGSYFIYYYKSRSDTLLTFEKIQEDCLL